MLFKRYPNCNPVVLNIPLWQKKIGFFLRNIGNWIAGYEWGVDRAYDVFEAIKEKSENQ